MIISHSAVATETARGKYRPDIDGLRAIAVISVVLHHINSALLPGGFVGVDIFFVISGFLITSHIHKELLEGGFSFVQFYKRRINRIFPALFVVIATSVSVGLFVLSPADILKLLKSGLFASLGVSNIYFWREYGNYFSGNASEAPLLHTWSLGVEEQFYAIWPLIFAFIYKIPRRYSIIILAALVVASLAVSEVALGFAASASYYLLPTRFFELMFGGILSLIALRIVPKSSSSAGLAAVAGLAMIVSALFLIDKTTPFPGFHAAWPCLGTMLVIWSGCRDGYQFGLLSNRLMVFVGLISYSLYLWHWPVIAYLNYLFIEIRAFESLCVLIFSVFLAWLTWRFVEIPQRRSGASLPFLRVFLIRFSLPVFILIFFSAAAIKMDGFPRRFDPMVSEMERAVQSKPEILRAGCHVPTAMYSTPPDFVKCRIGYDKADLDGILIGDSFANHFTGMLDVMANEAKKTYIDYTMDGCPPILNWDTGKGSSYSVKCKMRNAAVYSLIKEKKFGKVILAASWPDSKEAGRLLNHSIDEIISTGADVVLILNNSSIVRASSCPIRSAMRHSNMECSAAMRELPSYLLDSSIIPDVVHVINPNKVICNHGVCNPTIGNTPIYRDDVHLNDVGSRLIGKLLISSGEKI